MKKYKIIENEIEYDIEELDGQYKFWKYKGKIHRKNNPAAEWTDGTKTWYKYGKIHREDGPAIVWANGKEEYWLDSKHYLNVNSIDELIIASIIT